VQVTFDPSVISFREILEVFFTIHDPTTPNRQGNDVGTVPRRSSTHRAEQEQAARAKVIAQLEQDGLWRDKIVTEVTPLDRFYPAEAYHQDYFARNPYQPYCHIVIAPKVAKARQKYLARLKSA
jgi:peptide-methionine (S)-S-oxide reductase